MAVATAEIYAVAAVLIIIVVVRGAMDRQVQAEDKMALAV